MATSSEELIQRNLASKKTNGLHKTNGQVLHQEHPDEEKQLSQEQQQQKQNKEYKVQIVWKNVILMSMLHFGAFIGLRQCFVSAQWKTIVFAYMLYHTGKVGVTAGTHRLWSHRCYKAKLPLRILLAVLQSMAFENSIYEWCRDHRAHHKWSETNADPHNASRGFFFSHVGWLLCRKHPDVRTKGKSIDLSDLEEDSVVMFQHKYYLQCVLLMCFIVPAIIPWIFWGETLYNSFYICSLLRYTIALHTTWLVNSAAHLWGRRPYDKSIGAVENPAVSFLAFGEGFHNYHHTFPWDYSTSELNYELNTTKLYIDFFALIGWAYDRKVVSPETIANRKAKTGDVAEKGPYGSYQWLGVF